MLFSYFIICNTDDPKVFHIECTSMPDYRLRFSAMKSIFSKKFNFIPLKFNSKCKSSDTHSQGDSEGIPNYMRVFQTNFYYYLLEKREFETVDQALEYKEKLITERLEKFKNFTPECKFKVTFNQPELHCDTLEANPDASDISCV